MPAPPRSPFLLPSTLQRCAPVTLLFPAQSQLFLTSVPLSVPGPLPGALPLSVAKLHLSSSRLTSVYPLRLGSDMASRNRSLNLLLEPCFAFVISGFSSVITWAPCGGGCPRNVTF